MDKILENSHAWVILNGEQFFLDSILLFVFNSTKWFSVKMYPIFGELLTFCFSPFNSLAFQPINTIHHLLLPHETGANVTSFPGSLPLGTRLAQTISSVCFVIDNGKMISSWNGKRKASALCHAASNFCGSFLWRVVFFPRLNKFLRYWDGVFTSTLQSNNYDAT